MVESPRHGCEANQVMGQVYDCGEWRLSMGQPNKMNNGDDCEAKQLGDKRQLRGEGDAMGSDMYVFQVTIARRNGKSEKWEVHYKPTVAKEKWRIGKDGKMADFPAGLDAIKDACIAARKG